MLSVMFSHASTADRLKAMAVMINLEAITHDKFSFCGYSFERRRSPDGVSVYLMLDGKSLKVLSAMQGDVIPASARAVLPPWIKTSQVNGCIADRLLLLVGAA